MQIKLSILIATLGRATLSRSLDSLRGQLLPGDECLVIGDGPRPQARLMAVQSGIPQVRYLDGPPTTPVYGGGGEQRTWGATQATGTHLLYLDDDCVTTPGAMACIREAIKELPDTFLIFRCYRANWKDLIWHTKDKVALGNLDTNCLCVPNVSARLAPWGKKRLCDWEFVQGLLPHYSTPIFRMEVIAAHLETGGRK